MQIQTDEMRGAMGGADGVVPRRPGLMDAWIRVLDVFVRILTFGRGRVVREMARGPVRWDGNLKREMALSGLTACVLHWNVVKCRC